mgnify:CR=1 FL=1
MKVSWELEAGGWRLEADYKTISYLAYKGFPCRKQRLSFTVVLFA